MPTATSAPTNVQALDRASLIEVLEMTERWARRDEGKFSVYVPNPVMHHFHKSSARSRLLAGGNRSGKTYAEMIEVSSQFQGKAPKNISPLIPPYRLDPRRRIRFCTVDYPNNFVKVIWPYIQQLIPSDAIVDVIKDSGRIRAITNAHGGFVEFMTYESEVSKFQGSSRHVIFYDEEPPEEIRDENLMRLVDTDGEEVFAMTPINEANYGQTSPWVFDKLFAKASLIAELDDHKEVLLKNDPDGNPDIHCFFADIFDNQAISAEAAERILSQFSDEEREVRQSGHFKFLSGLVHKEYSERYHLINDFDDWWRGPDQDLYTLYVFIDPHPRTPMAVSFYVVRADGVKIQVDEIWSHIDSVYSFVETIKAKCNGKIPEFIGIDPSAFIQDQSQTGCLAYDIIAPKHPTTGFPTEGLVPYPMEASKDRARGIILTKEALLERNIQGDMGMLRFTRSCKRTRYEFTHYLWDSFRKSTAAVKGEKQKPRDKDDHMMENLHRFLLLNPQYVKPSFSPREEIEINSLRKGRNATTGY